MKKLIIGITGSIAAFKTVQFISDKMKEKYEPYYWAGFILLE